MGSRVVAAEFLEFDLKTPNQFELSLNAILEGVEQRNSAQGDTVRAILITFTAEDESAEFRFRATCRVIFKLDMNEQYADGDAFLDENLKTACDVFYDKSNRALKDLGWNEFPFVQLNT